MEVQTETPDLPKGTIADQFKQIQEKRKTTGHPAENAGPPTDAHEEEIKADAKVLEEPKKESKIKIADKEFSSYEEAIEYAREVAAKEKARKEIQEESKSKSSEEGVQEKDPLQGYVEELSELMFTDQNAFIAKVIELASQTSVQLMRNEQESAEFQRKTWGSFYEKNPHLKEFDDLVKSEFEKKYIEYKDDEVDTALTKLASHMNGLLKIKEDQLGQKTILSSDPASLASGGLPTSIPDKEKAPVLAFVDQMRKYQKGKGKA
jgi:hypothetical protein